MEHSEEYPNEVKSLEESALKERREQSGITNEKPFVGISLSGGGVRSSTQCLGAFQALKNKDLAKELDYMSTVSGGGYFGTFWSRANIEGDTDLDMNNRKMKYLRNAGNYISPTGSTELLKALSQLFARWLGLMSVMILFVFSIALVGRFLPHIPQVLSLGGYSLSIYCVVPVIAFCSIVLSGFTKIFTSKSLSSWMYFSVKLFLAGMAIGIIDTIGLNMYLKFTLGEISTIGALSTLILYVFNIGKSISLKLPGVLKKYSLSVMVFSIITIILGTISSLTHYVSWSVIGFSNFELIFSEWQGLLKYLGVIIVTGGISFLLGKKEDLLNDLSFHSIFQDKLVRSFLGAAVPERLIKGKMYSTDFAKDDILEKDYKPYKYGSPLHIFNLTLNETIDGRSNLYQLNRKGCNLAVVPGLSKSLGVRHHATVYEGGDGKLMHQPLLVKSKKFQVWGNFAFQPEESTIGRYMAISAAAISTGMGKHTSLVKSMITGLLGTRLGYWWDSGITRNHFENLYNGFFQNQRLYLREMTSRFFGTKDKKWYLSDGGHFDNMGTYELIRRRLKFIIALDFGGDSKYNFNSLADLTRIVRADFGAEVRWMTNKEMDTFINPKVRGLFGSKSNLKKWQGSLDGIEFDGKTVHQGTGNWAKAYSAILEVTYSDGSIGHILYVKPTLTGSEPIDVKTYYQKNPVFPQESTKDQFFDEEQWESYRKLMEHIVGKLFEYDDLNTPTDWLKNGLVLKNRYK